MKLGVITDAHGNLPALQAILGELDGQVDEIVQLGDAVDMAPWPRETVELLIEANVNCLIGNHDWLVAHTGPDLPDGWSTVKHAHTRWSRAQMPPHLLDWLVSWPTLLRRDRVSLVHYAGSLPDYAKVAKPPTGPLFDSMFADVPGDLVLYGHHHPENVIHGAERTYINPGSLGCNDRPLARGLIVDTLSLTTEQLRVIYDPTELRQAMREFKVPGREEILRDHLPALSSRAAVGA